jgi:hypothetical protein
VALVRFRMRDQTGQAVARASRATLSFEVRRRESCVPEPRVHLGFWSPSERKVSIKPRVAPERGWRWLAPVIHGTGWLGWRY